MRALGAGALGIALVSGLAWSAPPPALDSKVDEEIEEALPEAEMARLEGKLGEVHAKYADRTDRAGKILSAWTLADDQEIWNGFKALAAERPEAWVDVGQAVIYLRWKTWDQAGVSLQRVHTAAPKLAEAFVVSGDLARLQNNPAAAEAAYRQALTLRPNDVLALDGLGRLANAAGKSDEALKQFSAARAIFADDPVAAFGIETAKVALGDLAGALAALDDEHRLLPNDADAWVRSGKLKVKQGDATGAAKDFEAARKLGSNDPDLLQLLSSTYKTQGRVADERQLLDDLISQGVATAEQYARRGELRKEKDPKGAVADLQKAVELSKKDPNLMLRLAGLIGEQGDLSAAIGLYRSAAATKPEAKAPLAELEQRVGLAKKPLKGSIGQINTALGSELNRQYHLLLKQHPELQGSLKIRVTVNDKGSVDEVEWLENSVNSPELTANLRWNAEDARYPTQAAKYVLKFALSP